MNKALYLLLVFLISLNTAADAQYKRIGPKGGTGFSFYKDGGRIWLASNTGVYYTDDNGISWVFSSVPANAFGGDNVLSVAASTGELYAATENLGIFHSTDAGVTWGTVNTGLKIAAAKYSDVEIAGPNALVIRPDSALLLLTTNHGLAWQKINFAILNARALSLSLHNNLLYVVASTGLFTSANNGITFNQINPAVTNGNLYWANDTAYLAGNNGIQQSLDFGLSFAPVGLGGRNVRSVAASGNNIYATVAGATEDTVKYSTDGGFSFNNAPTSSTFSFKKVYDLTMGGNALLIASNYNVYCTRNSGSTWIPCDSGFISTVVKGIAANGPILQAGTTPAGVFRTLDSAASWLHNGDYSHGVNGMIQCIEANGAHVYAGDSAQYYHSTDNGVTWTIGATGLGTGNVSAIYAVKGTADVWVIQNGNLYYSLNSGASFTAVPSVGVPLGRAFFLTGLDSVMFSAVDGGLYRAGSNKVFSLVASIGPRITGVVRNGTTWYASTDGEGLYNSPDGVTWTRFIPTVGSLPVKINCLAVDSGSLVVGTNDGLYSNKGGGIWDRDSLQGRIILSLFVNSGHLYVGTSGGVFTQAYPPPLPVSVGPVINRSGGALTVYPNPADRQFHISFQSPHASTAQLNMVDLSGRVVMQKSLQVRSGQNDFEIAVSSSNALPTGIYTVQVMSEGLEYSSKIELR